MVNSVGLISYVSGGIAFALLGIALLTVWRGRLGPLLLIAVAVTVVWCLVLAINASIATVPAILLFLIELARDAFWLIFLISLILSRNESAFASRLRLSVHGLWIALLLIGSGTMLFGSGDAVGAVFVFGFFVMALSGLVVTEQVYRNTVVAERWSVKFLCLALAGLFAFDLIFYAKGIMYRGLDHELWNARGFIHALIAPLIALSASRSAKWSAGLFVSRQIAFYTTSLFGAGLYLLAMSAGGYYVRIRGGDWGTVAQATVVFGGMLLLLVILFSGQIRARIRVFLNKHFFRYKYDYREEWLRLTRLLSSDVSDMPLRDRAIMSVANPVESPGGALWLASDGGTFDLLSRWNMQVPGAVAESLDGDLAVFLSERSWVIDIGEYRKDPGLYGNLKIPQWLDTMNDAWLVVPLIRDDVLSGFIVLAQPRAPQTLTWEDLDLLKTVGRQVAGYLEQDRAARMLAEASQFQAFNRFTAFIMHDLKNLIAQQSLVVKNAARHKHNPEFIDDAISTVDNSVRRMSRLLEQLRQGEAPELTRRLRVEETCEEVATQCTPRSPDVDVTIDEAGMEIEASRDGLVSVLGHVVRNGQDAAGPNGRVGIRICRRDDNAVIEVMDNGPGMNEQFIRERLFQPFESTKGSKGMGIGAYQAREFVSALGGRVEVESTVGRGTVFRLVFPLVDSLGHEVMQKTGAV
ncbi:MAG: PEP-CTERM system histidine kinase PrsK [Gammaproteobacteria bacterium]|nr:PEP-CTERM system histidine kinase PrsK [Gammaproteobacteria bacterium]